MKRTGSAQARLQCACTRNCMKVAREVHDSRVRVPEQNRSLFECVCQELVTA